MIILIMGASHTGKTKLAQSLLEKYKYPYLSIDHLKMGLIRSGHTGLTAIENKQNLIVEGCYISFDWKKYFEKEYLENIKCICLVMSKNYIERHFNDIKKYANVVESRIDDSYCTMESVLRENAGVLKLCQSYNIDYTLINDEYKFEIEL